MQHGYVFVYNSLLPGSEYVQLSMIRSAVILMLACTPPVSMQGAEKKLYNVLAPPPMEDIGAFRTSTSALDYFSAHSNERTEVEVIVNKFLALPNLPQWAPVRDISEEHPYLFFHARKAAGSTLRSDLYDAANILGLSFYIACEGGVDCDTYKLPHNQSNAIYAMHMHWGDQFRLKELQKRHRGPHQVNDIHHPSTDSYLRYSTTDGIEDIHHSFSCMSNMREPVSRIISCIKFRFLDDSHNGKFSNTSCIGDLSLEELYHLLADEVDEFANSCLNEPFRVFSGLYDEDVINSLGIELDTSRHLALPNLSNLSLHALQATLKHYQQCAPYILELPVESSDLLAYKFPDLYSAGAYRLDMANNVGGDSERCSGDRSKPTAQQMHLLEHFAAYERVLYDAVVQKVKVAHAELLTTRSALTAVGATKAKLKKVMKEQFSRQPKWLQARQRRVYKQQLRGHGDSLKSVRTGSESVEYSGSREAAFQSQELSRDVVVMGGHLDNGFESNGSFINSTSPYSMKDDSDFSNSSRSSNLRSETNKAYEYPYYYKHYEGRALYTKFTPTSNVSYVSLLDGLGATNNLEYRSMLLNILVTKRSLEMFGSTADFIVMYGFYDDLLGNTDSVTRQRIHKRPSAVDEEVIDLVWTDLAFLETFGIKLHRLEPFRIPLSDSACRNCTAWEEADEDKMLQITLHKVEVWGLKMYERIQFLDGDLMPLVNMDCLFYMEPFSGADGASMAAAAGLTGDQAAARITAFEAGWISPLNAGWALVTPNHAEYQSLRQWAVWRLKRGWRWDWRVGYGEAIPEGLLYTDPPAYWGNRQNVTDWGFYGADLEQGLFVYHFAVAYDPLRAPRDVTGGIRKPTSRKTSTKIRGVGSDDALFVHIDSTEVSIIQHGRVIARRKPRQALGCCLGSQPHRKYLHMRKEEHSGEWVRPSSRMVHFVGDAKPWLHNDTANFEMLRREGRQAAKTASDPTTNSAAVAAGTRMVSRSTRHHNMNSGSASGSVVGSDHYTSVTTGTADRVRRKLGMHGKGGKGGSEARRFDTEDENRHSSNMKQHHTSPHGSSGATTSSIAGEGGAQSAPLGKERRKDQYLTATDELQALQQLEVQTAETETKIQDLQAFIEKRERAEKKRSWSWYSSVESKQRLEWYRRLDAMRLNVRHSNLLSFLASREPLKVVG